MMTHDFDNVLKQMEVQMDAITTALLCNESPEMVSTSAVMLQVSRELGQFLEGHRELTLSAEDRRRIQAISGVLAAQREGLLRRTAMVEQLLGSLVPATRKATYSGRSGPFGSGTQQSGAFKLLSA